MNITTYIESFNFDSLLSIWNCGLSTVVVVAKKLPIRVSMQFERANPRGYYVQQYILEHRETMKMVPYCSLAPTSRFILNQFVIGLNCSIWQRLMQRTFGYIYINNIQFIYLVVFFTQTRIEKNCFNYQQKVVILRKKKCLQWQKL